MSIRHNAQKKNKLQPSEYVKTKTQTDNTYDGIEKTKTNERRTNHYTRIE